MTFGVGVEGPSDYQFWHKVLHKHFRRCRFDVRNMKNRDKLIRETPKLLDTFRDCRFYVTTANLNHEQLQALSDEVGAERSLLVVCSAFRGRKEGYANLTVKKIPKAVLSRCEWGHDDYSLQVENLPKAPPKLGQQEMALV